MYDLVRSLPHPRRKRVQFHDRVIVLVYLWSALWDRPVCWACDPGNWAAFGGGGGGGGPPFELPSGTTMSRRLWTVGVQQLLGRARTPPAMGVRGVEESSTYQGIHWDGYWQGYRDGLAEAHAARRSALAAALGHEPVRPASRGHDGEDQRHHRSGRTRPPLHRCADG